ncbi:MAG: DNA adenine methylase [Elusimicrobia bacterium]|nr:DNA adenine methylase [Elusimicrobiota bacterium]
MQVNSDDLVQNNTLAYRKKIFLDRIKSSNPDSRNKYKRVVETPIRYAGGKSLAVGFIIELLPDNIKRLISPFFGGGSVEIACNKYLGLEVVGYDIFDILVNYWNVQINKPNLLFRKLSKLRPDAKTYKQVKEELKKHWKGVKKLSPINLAAYYYFNHNLSYGPGFLGWPSEIYFDKDRYSTMLNKVQNFSAANLEVRCADFEESFKKYPNDFFYCDPPYLLGHGTKMFRGIYPMRNIPVHHNGFNHEKLRNLLKNHKGGFVLSYNNCAAIRNWYSEYKQYFPQWQYTMGQGETRIGKNRQNGNGNHIKQSHEILIYCPPRI